METPLAPLELKQALHEIEDRHGRLRDVPKYSDRTLDIDILLFNDLYLLSPELEIPRDEILTSPHVLKPLADLAPAAIGPYCQAVVAGDSLTALQLCEGLSVWVDIVTLIASNSAYAERAASRLASA